MAQVARDFGMEIVSCAEEYDLLGLGIKPGKCIDDEYDDLWNGCGDNADICHTSASSDDPQNHRTAEGGNADIYHAASWGGLKGPLNLGSVD